MLETESKLSQNNQTSGTLPQPPSFLGESISNTPVEYSIHDQFMNEQPTKDTWSTIQAPVHNQQSSSSSFNTVIHNIPSKPLNRQSSVSPKHKLSNSQKQWKNFTCETLQADHNVTASLLPENNLERKHRLNNHLNGTNKENQQPPFYSNSQLHKSCPMLSNDSQCHYQNTNFIQEEVNIQQREFKLDHLLDINPKRLFKGCKFRCRIHDVIDENGQFWMEVIYSKEEERKFVEIFKLFRLCSEITAKEMLSKNALKCILQARMAPGNCH